MTKSSEAARKKIRQRNVRRMFDPLVQLDDDFEHARPLQIYRGRVRPLLKAKHQQEQGKSLLAAKPTWSLPASASRGRPTSDLGVRIPHTRLSVGGYSSESKPVGAIHVDRYNCRQEDDVAIALTVAAEAVKVDDYLNRLENDAIECGELSAIRTNMDPNPDKRELEWTARTRHERKAGDPRININSDRDPALCAAIASDHKWPEGLRIAIERDLARAKAGGTRPLSKKAGEPWVDPQATKIFEKLCKEFGLRPQSNDGALSYGKPRAGRVYSKWEAELPRELDEAGRQAYLDATARRLSELGLSFVLAMHRPDKLNHADNYHVHLLYSDRPVTKLADGSFDIERVVERDYGRGRRRLVHERQNKTPAARSRNWAMTLRNLHVDACNMQMELSGATGRYSSGGFADAGISEDERQCKLGAAASRYESAGVGTVKGVENALIDWQRVDSARVRKHERRLTRLAAIHHTRLSADPAHAQAWDEWVKTAQAAEDARYTHEEVSDVIAMATSRPRAVIEKAGAIAASLKEGKSDRAGWLARVVEAEHALAVINIGLT
ncbi:MAG: MobA/MobL family protein [Sphingomonas bacterium]|nr:MobA/MobL family protein [Sphingomonas bacterium]